jgi:hypothetical protein
MMKCEFPFQPIFRICFAALFIAPYLHASNVETAPLTQEQRLELERFLADPRFHWTQWPLVPHLHRKPPNLFPFQLASLTYSEMTALPTGLTAQEAAFFQGVFETLRDLSRSFVLIKLVESDVQTIVAESSQQLSDRDLRITALHSLMTVYEKRFGFSVVELNRSITASEWAEFLAAGKTFIDRAGAGLGLELGPGLRTRPGHWLHPQLAHRFQLHLILRDKVLRPDRYGRPEDLLQCYKALGMTDFNSRLDWSSTGLDAQSAHDLYFELFDSPENNASSPGFFFDYKDYWPDLLIP